MLREKEIERKTVPFSIRIYEVDIDRIRKDSEALKISHAEYINRLINGKSVNVGDQYLNMEISSISYGGAGLNNVVKYRFKGKMIFTTGYRQIPSRLLDVVFKEGILEKEFKSLYGEVSKEIIYSEQNHSLTHCLNVYETEKSQYIINSLIYYEDIINHFGMNISEVYYGTKNNGIGNKEEVLGVVNNKLGVNEYDFLRQLLTDDIRYLE